MANRCRSARTRHDRMVLRVARRLVGRGYTDVRADHVRGAVRPDPLNGCRPDVTGWVEGSFMIVEVETCETISLAETCREWQAFSTGRFDRTAFVVVAPRDCLYAARVQAEAWGIEVDGFWTGE